MINVNVSVKSVMCVWNPCSCNCEIRKYLGSIIDDSAIICFKLIESYDGEAKTIFIEKKATCKMQKFFILIVINYYSIITSN